MHKLNILIYGSKNFISTFTELKPYLKFNLITNEKDISNLKPNDLDGVIFHDESLDNKKSILQEKNYFSILASSKKNNNMKKFDYILNLPTTVKEINNIVEGGAVKKKFSENSSIKIKSYLLDKNEKKLSRKDSFVILTEKEIQLLELFLNKEKAISKSDILSQVWHYASDADTHTVETHIYRLRKKINDKFSDNNFILNNKEGYYL
tara:strand:- start:1118 stop:1738 length:621 start_codon:yes stop_codon:yes gene_type:complete